MLLSGREEELVRCLTKAIESLAGEIHESHTGAVTRHDLAHAEARLTASIKGQSDLSPEDKAILDSLLSRSSRIARKLEKLDAQTPPAP